MRIHLKIAPNVKTVPFVHQHLLTGSIHKWLGKENDLHDGMSLYSFSMLTGGKAVKDGLKFYEGADFFISAWDKQMIQAIITGIQNDPVMFEGLKVSEIIIQPSTEIANRTRFLCASPVFIKRTIDNSKVKFYFHTDSEADELMTETLHHKMQIAGLQKDESLRVSFDQSYAKAKTKQIIYKNIKNLGSICPLIIEGKPESKEFAWNVGIGNSTGIGFGAIK